MTQYQIKTIEEAQKQLNTLHRHYYQKDWRIKKKNPPKSSENWAKINGGPGFVAIRIPNCTPILERKFTLSDIVKRGLRSIEITIKMAGGTG